jgi:hypothetical protein
MIGDSFFAATHQIGAELEQLARSAGVLSTDEHYRDVSKLTANTLVVSGNGILEQFETAASESPALTLIMNAGGADMLIGICASADASCPLIVDSAAALRDVLKAASARGVRDVIYVSYPDPTMDERTRDKLDLFRPLAQEACASSPVPCHWLDLRPVFAGHYDTYVQADGLNPTTEGSRATAAAIWDALRLQCATSP